MKKFRLVLLLVLVALMILILAGCDFFKGPQSSNDEFVITFDTQGGSEIAPITIRSGESLTLPKAPTKDGYVFDGWYLDSNCIEAYEDSYVVSKNITLYAKWRELVAGEEFNVIFNLNYGTDNIVEKTTENRLITYIPVRQGYRFNGWYYSDGYVEGIGYILTEKYDTTIPVTQNGLVLYAEWVDSSTDSRQLASPTISVNGTVLSWDAVKNAEKYELKFYLGKSLVKTYFTTQSSVNIDSIGIDAGTYTLKARSIGDGVSHINSAETIKHISYKVLLPVSNAKIDVESSVLTWNEANNAEAYTVYIDGTRFGRTYLNSLDLSKLNAGQYVIKIVAERAGYTSSNATFTLVKSRLLTPTIKIERQPNDNYSSKISWSAIYNANQYVVVVDKKEVATTSDNYYVLKDSDWGSNKKVSVSVYAKDSSADYLVSIPSEISTVTRTAKIAISHNIRNVSLVKVIGKSYSSTDNLIEDYSSADNFYVGVDFGEPKKVVAIPQNGYTWLGWYDKSGNLISTKTEYIFNVGASSSEIVAHWASYSVALNKNDNNAGKIGFSVDDMSTQNTVSQRIVYGKEVTICASTNNGYTWLGWYKGDEKVSNEQTYTFTMSDSDLAFTAKWSKTTISVSSSSAGSVSGLSSTYKVGDKVTVTAVTNTGYTWDGWYLNGEKVSSDLQYEIQITEEPLNYVATWKYYTLTTSRNISAAGTVNSYWNQKVTVGDSVELVANTNKGYTWLGWYDGEILISSETTFTYEMPAESKTLIAKWTYYTLSTQANDSEAGTYTVLSDKKVTVGDSIELVVSTNDGYTWLGWYDGETMISSETTYTYVMPAESKTITAKWEIITYSITYSYTYETEFETLLRTSYTHKDSNIVLEMPNNGTYYVDYWYYFGEADTRITEIDISTKRDLMVVGHVASCGLRLFGSSIVEIGTCTQTELLLPRYNGEVEITQIGRFAFQGCTGLTSIVIPDSVTSIGDYAFDGCTGLTSVTIGNRVTSIGNNAFDGCYRLVEVYNKSSLTITAGSSDNGYVAYFAKNVYLNEGGSKLTTNENGYVIYTDGDEKILVAYIGTETELTLPADITQINKYAFRSCTNLTSITIPNNVTSIGNSAFDDCTGLTSVTIGNGVTSIGDYAFERCTNLANISGFADNVSIVAKQSKSSSFAVEITSGTSIGISAFHGCSGLTSVTIGNSVTSIGSGAFYGCTGLTSIVIPDSVTRIGDLAFYNCSGLKSITIPDSVTSIGNGAFDDCTGLANISGSADNVSIVAKNARPSSFAVEITSGTSIGGSAFYGCSGLTSVTIGNSVTSISSSAFSGCTGLKRIAIGKGVTSLQEGLLRSCASLESITIPFVGEKSSVTSSDTYQYPFGHIFGRSSYDGGVATTQYYYGWSTSSTMSTTYYIPSSLKSVTVTGGNILYGAFYGCTGLTSITIPDSVTSIGQRAFYGCTGLTSVTIPDSVTSIGDYAFYGCYRLIEVYNKSTLSITAGSSSNGYVAYYAKNVYSNEGGSKLTTDENGYVIYTDGDEKILVAYIGTETELTLPADITQINKYAFRDCTGLTSVTIPNSVTSIGNYAFEGCSGLTSIVANGNTKYHSAGNCLIETESKTIVLGCKNSVIPTDGSVTSIGVGAFYGCTGLTSITIPDSVTSIGQRAFYGCTGLTSVTIPDSVTSIGDYAFYGCSGLTSVTIGNSVTRIGDGAFYGCTGLTSIYYTGDVAGWCGISGLVYLMSSSRTLYIGGKKVEGELIIPDSVTSIGNYAFEGCSGLTSVTIPNSVTSIGNYAFEGCSGLTSIVANGNTKYHSAGNCLIETESKTIVLGCKNSVIPTDGSVTSIGVGAFYGCTGLTSITIPDSVTSIGQRAFYGCTGLTSVTIPDSVTSIGDYAFCNCSSLTSVTIPDSVTSIGSSAFLYCTGLTSVTIGNSVTSIGSSAFYNCYKLIEVYNKSSLTITAGSSDNGYVAYYAKNVYTNEGGSKLSIDENGYVIYTDGTEKILVAYTGSETELSLPSDITQIYKHAFNGCTGLTSVTIGNSVTSIGGAAFEGCTELTSVTFGDTSSWYRTNNINNWNNKSGGTLTDVTSATTNATYFKTTYKNDYWYKL